MRESDALEQGKRIYASIGGWGVSSDGKGGITRPKASTLAEVPADERAHLAEAITTSGHPDRVGIAELAEVFEEVARLSSSPR
ncbi:hypothetical protein [Amycolatopsis sp. NPDC003861]